MKAIVIHEFGGSDKLTLTELPRPEPRADEVRIKTAYTAVNPVDWKIREGYLQGMFPHHFPLIPGWDVAGVVDEVGKDVRGLRKGELVYAYARKPEVQAGTYAEYVTVAEAATARIPANLDLAQAATVPLVGLTAWQALRRFGGLKSGPVARPIAWIHGGAGGVGSFAIPFAKAAGAKVIATASPANHAYLKQLGADIVVDYRGADFASVLKANGIAGVDFVLDTIGGETLARSYRLVRQGGAIVSIAEEPKSAPGIQTAFLFVSPSADDLREIGKLIEQGKVGVPELQILPLAEARRAQELSATGHVKGKILLKA